MKAIIFSHLYNRGEEIFVADEIEFIVCPRRDEEEFLALQKKHQAMAVVLDSRPYSEKFFQSLLPQTLIVRFGTGVDNIPKGIFRYGHRVANTPGSSTSSVCEYVFTTMGMLSKGIWAGHRELIQNRWVRSTGRELRGQRLAVLGLGRIGMAVASIAQARHGMGVIGLCRKNTLTEKEQLQKQYSAQFPLTDNLLEAIQGADFISLHLSLNPENEYILNQDIFPHCKPKAFIINTARGKHIRETDLRTALHQGQIAGVALDVFEREPYSPNLTSNDIGIPQLSDFPNVILTPHIAGHTEEANLNTAIMVVENIRAFYQQRWEQVHWVDIDSNESN